MDTTTTTHKELVEYSKEERRKYIEIRSELKRLALATGNTALIEKLDEFFDSSLRFDSLSDPAFWMAVDLTTLRVNGRTGGIVARII